jgi:HPt (histidine-containing phosphotransfer) domain-containing protein
MMDRDKVTNLDYLEELAKGNTEFIEDMISIFLAENPEELRELELAILQKDFELIQSVSHHMRSTISFVGLDPLVGNDLSEIEKWAIKKEQIENITVLFAKIKEVCQKAFFELKP